MTRRIEFTVADEIAERYDEARGHEPLASWIKRALEKALEETRPASRPVAAGTSEPSRTSKKKPTVADTWRR